jgi:hypothetical protein
MKRRSLGVGLLALASSLLLLVGTASAHETAGGGTQQATGTCEVHTLPAFVAQGEFEQSATVADVIEVECNPFIYGTGSKIKLMAAQLYSRCNGSIRWYEPDP